ANAVTCLPIFRHYHVDRHQVFASIDGQKFETRINTFKARFSAKYFRQGKGVSAMTLVSNHIPLNTKIIGANEYEGHHVLDLLYNNTTDLQPDTISTDTHGTNRVNFALLDFFGYAFAPRYARVKRIFEQCFVINPQAGDNEPFIQLTTPANHPLIIAEWDALQRILCSLHRKNISQSTIVQKLNNNKRSDKTLAALEEYDRLVKCCYLLDYVDNETLRGYIQKMLNRGEAYHQLRRAIASVNGNRFIGGSDYHVELANECARLIANCIVYYNSAILSFLLARYERKRDQRAVDIITRVSPVAWQNVNLNGNYSFQQDNTLLDLEALLAGVKPEER
ncbi:MAG: Tn3 family transposase, partial [Pseudomonadales bacterium]